MERKETELGHDKSGSYIGKWSKDNPDTWHDVMGKEFRKCSKCGRFLSLDEFSESKRNKGELLNRCKDCCKKSEEANRKWREKKSKVSCLVKHNDEAIRQMASLLPDEYLFAELRKRGFK